jgi:crotonobetainyl-CoA:carnitine CoA-transferase CaiB-like acyl-CoA transferase
VADSGLHCQFFNEDVQVDANDMAVEVVHPAWGPYRRPTPGVSLSLTPGYVGPGNRPGEHTRLILEEIGYSEAEIADLKEKSVVTWPE